MTENKDKIERVAIENVGKRFVRKYRKNDRSILSKIISAASRKDNNVEFDALKDVTFKVFSGENLGVIGKNGSGKSTLLRIIAGIYNPDSGFVKTDGKLIYITGFGQGLQQKLTMKENIYLVGSIMGLSKEEIDNKLEEIIEFSGLRDYLYAQVYQFSSGMITKLGFSISIHCLKHHNPDILVVDEVFGGGGDITFEDKATKKMEELIKGGTTVIMASHSLPLVKEYCDKVVLLDEGKMAGYGEPGEIIDIYLKRSASKSKEKSS